jgi:adenylylsulfate kinase
VELVTPGFQCSDESILLRSATSMTTTTQTADQDISWQTGHVTAADRATLLGQKPATIWLTGLSGAGKTTLAFALEQRLHHGGKPCFVLDGDNIRHGISRGLRFDRMDRSENNRRIAEVAKLMNDAGLIVIVSFISPYVADRAIAREIIGSERFLEVHVCTSLAVCERRDTKGLYAGARQGNVQEFTGISAPYEAPPSPALSLDTARLEVRESVDQLIALLKPCIGDGTNMASSRPDLASGPGEQQEPGMDGTYGER